MFHGLADEIRSVFFRRYFRTEPRTPGTAGFTPEAATRVLSRSPFDPTESPRSMKVAIRQDLPDQMSRENASGLDECASQARRPPPVIGCPSAPCVMPRTAKALAIVTQLAPAAFRSSSAVRFSRTNAMAPVKRRPAGLTSAVLRHHSGHDLLTRPSHTCAPAVLSVSPLRSPISSVRDENSAYEALWRRRLQPLAKGHPGCEIDQRARSRRQAGGFSSPNRRRPILRALTRNRR